MLYKINILVFRCHIMLITNLVRRRVLKVLERSSFTEIKRILSDMGGNKNKSLYGAPVTLISHHKWLEIVFLVRIFLPLVSVNIDTCMCQYNPVHMHVSTGWYQLILT